MDPEYASAYVMLGYANFMDFVFGSNRDSQTLEQVSALARKAISLDDASFLAHVLLADIYRTKGQFEQAILQAQRALSLNPNDPSAYQGHGECA